tara:strand:- start:237 stop:620 length:384 start_codon:yes stop_codon:yes gene_type:complete
MVSANNLKQYTTPDVSQMTLDVIDAIKTKQKIQFNYGTDTEEYREILPQEFFGDFEGFGGLTNMGEYRKFLFSRVIEWVGIPIYYKVFVELDVVGYPTDKDVAEKLHELLDSAEPIMYTLKPQSGDK